MSKEYIISLIMESNNSSATKFWVKMEYRGEHSTDCMTESCV